MPHKYYRKAEHRPSSWKRIKKRFGLLGMLTFMSGIIIIPGVVAVLSALWYLGFEAEAHPRNNILAILALQGWLPQTITILSAVLRYSITAQVVTASMMMASLALGHNAITDGDDRHDLVILQEASPGPSALALPFAKAAMRGRYIRGLLLVVAMLGVSILSQFASTMLLSDFKSVHLLGFSRTLHVNMTTGDFDIDNFRSIGGRPVEYPLFAERAEGRNAVTPTTTSPGLFDTGNVSRAYVPLSAEDRVRLREYHGFATVLTTHTICFPPDLSNVTLIDRYRTGNIYEGPKGNESSWEAEFALTGTIPPPESALYGQYHGQRSFNLDRLFSYNLTGVVADNCPSFALYGLNICSLGTLPWAVIPDEGLTLSDSGDIDDGDVKWFLITRMEVPQKSLAQNLTRLLQNEATLQFDGVESVSQTYSDGEFSMTFHHSLCATRSIYTWANASVKSPMKDMTIIQEPRANRNSHSNNSQDNAYDLGGVLRQMGIDGEYIDSVEERGVFVLWDDHDLRNRTAYMNATIDMDEIIDTGHSGVQTVCIPSKEWSHHEPKVYYYDICTTSTIADLMAQQLLLNTYTQSGSLALAFEALSTFAFLALYTPLSTKDSAVNGNEPKYAVSSFIEDGLVPGWFLGLGLVLGTVVCHVASVLVVLKMFFGKRAYEPVADEFRRTFRDVDQRQY